jgi:hypothetical protein
VKIAICFPSHSHTKSSFTVSLAAMLMKVVTTMPHEFRLFHAEGHLPDVRNELAAQVLEWGADVQLCVDADQTFPEDTLHRLLAHDLDIVGANYPRRMPMGAPTAALDGQPVETRPDSPALQEVDSIGLGVCLIRTEVYRRLPEPWFTFPIKEGRHRGEDVAFCEAARAAGFKVYVDHDLSRQVGHIAEVALGFKLAT